MPEEKYIIWLGWCLGSLYVLANGIYVSLDPPTGYAQNGPPRGD